MGFIADIKKEKLKDFVLFTKKQLKLKTCPIITIQSHRKNLRTTANYDYSQETKKISVYGKNRALVDIMRSIAHEMVHHKQFEDGRLIVKPADIGSLIEDEANSIAGQLIKLYAQKDESIYDC